jgi:hypothetical protein
MRPAVISFRPYPPSGLCSSMWSLIEPEQVTISELVLTQAQVSVEGLFDQSLAPGADPYPNVVVWGETAFVEDGHHQVVLAWLRGEGTIMARVFRPE